MKQVSHLPLSMMGGLALAGLLALGAPAAAAAQQQRDVGDSETTAPGEGAQKLARLLEGRVAGAPVLCIPVWRNQMMTTIDGTAYVFGRGGTIWVQRTTRPQDIKRRYALVSQRVSGGELCRSDVALTVDPIGGFFTGSVIFEDFIPYTRVERAGAQGG